MNVKHRRLLALGLTVAFVAAMGVVHYALAVSADQTGLSATAKAAGVGSPKPILQIAGELIKAVLGLVGVIMLVLVLYAGFLWMTSQGEEAKVKRAKAILTNAIIGLVVIFSAYSITSYVFTNVYSATLDSTKSTGATDGGNPAFTECLNTCQGAACEACGQLMRTD